jgi:arabinofuranan 3-O-arabinosyltransferase
LSGLVLTRIGYQPAAQPVATTTQRWDVAHRTVAVAARPADTVLVVHENANLGWHATLGGRELRRVVADGWQQGYIVPAGAAGTVQLDFTPDRTYRAALVVGGLLVLGLLAAVAWGSRGRANHWRAVPAPARSGRLLLPVAGVVTAGLLAGWAGLAVATLVAAAALALRLRRPAWAGVAAPVVAAGSYLAAALWLVLHHAGTASYAGRSAGLQVLCALALSAVCWSEWAAPSHAAASSAPRRTGSSASQ